jgi:predicted RNA-binding Zn ribbon-like protein
MAPPPHVELLVAFTNSVDQDEGTDDLTTPDELSQWLHEHGLVSQLIHSTPADLDLALRLRDALHAAMVGNHDAVPQLTALAAVGQDLPLVLAEVDGRPGLRPHWDGVRGALSGVLVAVNEAVADDSWRRLKICSSDECAWAFFDATKNRSRTYCEWGCGNKIKSRNYRARQRATA